MLICWAHFSSSSNNTCLSADIAIENVHVGSGKKIYQWALMVSLNDMFIMHGE